MVEFPGVEQNCPKLEETPIKLAKNPLRNSENYETVQFFVWKT